MSCIVATGPYAGIHVRFEGREDQPDLVPIPLPQLGIKKTGVDALEYFLLDDLPHKGELDPTFYDIHAPRAFLLLGCSQADALPHLQAAGISIRHDTPFEPEEGITSVELTLTIHIDATIKRAVSKIAFNYLAFRYGSEAALQTAFDPIRRFIHDGTEPWYPPLRVLGERILGDERNRADRRVGHIINLGYASDRRSVLSQVSLFNTFTYNVALAPEYSGIYDFEEDGLFYNVGDMSILPINGIPPSIT